MATLAGPSAAAAPESVDAGALAENFRDISARVCAAAAAAARERTRPVTLVAVSKLKPAAAVRAVYDAGHRVFGENYVQELVDKAAALPGDIRWHMIGPVQSNKARALAHVPSLALVESVHSLKLARALDRECAAARRTLDVLVQVNTSGEDTKSGVAPSDVVELARAITTECPALRFRGLMTIGAPHPTASTADEQPDFARLAASLDEVSTALGLPRESLVLSMGMSGDFETAIKHGSDNVRVGTSIFGARAPKT